MIEVQETGRWYPAGPPMFPGESAEAYTDRLTGADRAARVPFDHSRNRQCSIGYHEECSDPGGDTCECPCHPERVNAHQRVAAWNASYAVGDVVAFVPGCNEPPVATTSEARVEGIWPVVELDTFEHPVKLSWLHGGEGTP